MLNWDYHSSIRAPVWACIPKFNYSKHRWTWCPHSFNRRPYYQQESSGKD